MKGELHEHRQQMRRDAGKRDLARRNLNRAQIGLDEGEYALALGHVLIATMHIKDLVTEAGFEWLTSTLEREVNERRRKKDEGGTSESPGGARL